MGLESIFDMCIIDSSIVLSEWGEIITKHDYELVPFLMYQWFDKDEIFADLIAEPIP